MNAPVEEWRVVAGSRAEVSNLGRVRDSYGRKNMLTPDPGGRVEVCTANGSQLRTVKSLFTTTWPEFDERAYRRLRQRQSSARRRRARPVTPPTPAAGFGRRAGPTSTAVLVSVARAEVLARRKGRAPQPHPGDDYDRREACTTDDRIVWLEEDLVRFDAWAEACAHLEEGIAKRSAAERERIADEISAGLK